jgi:hypothetical protein
MLLSRQKTRSRRRVGTVSDESKLLEILHFTQRYHHGVAFYRIATGERFTRSDSTLTTRARHHSPPRRTSQS